jgi:hypothetical protein
MLRNKTDKLSIWYFAWCSKRTIWVFPIIISKMSEIKIVRLLGFMYLIYMIFHGNCLKHCNMLDYCVFAWECWILWPKATSYIRYYITTIMQFAIHKCSNLVQDLRFGQFQFSRFDNSKIINQIEEQHLWILMKHI